jgi:hypothetical protein
MCSDRTREEVWNDQPAAQPPDAGQGGGKAILIEGVVEVRDGRYFSQMWFVNAGDRSMDWMAALWRDPGEGFVLQYRFRYYVDDRAHGSEDVKNWYRVNFKADVPEAEGLRAGNLIATLTAAQYGGELHKLVLRTDRAADVEAALRREKFMHFGEPNR